MSRAWPKEALRNFKRRTVLATFATSESEAIPASSQRDASNIVPTANNKLQQQFGCEPQLPSWHIWGKQLQAFRGTNGAAEDPVEPTSGAPVTPCSLQGRLLGLGPCSSAVVILELLHGWLSWLSWLSIILARNCWQRTKVPACSPFTSGGVQHDAC